MLLCLGEGMQGRIDFSSSATFEIDDLFADVFLIKIRFGES
jgi:hypothetical protein